MRKLLNILTLDGTNIAFFVLIYNLLIINTLLDNILQIRLPLAFLMVEIFPAYLLALFKQLFSKWKIAEKIYCYCVSLWVCIFFLIDYYCVNILHEALNHNTALLILDSNFNESIEFLNLYIQSILTERGALVFGSLGLCFFVYIIMLHKHFTFPYFVRIPLLVLSII